jgi:hypothetical protein
MNVLVNTCSSIVCMYWSDFIRLPGILWVSMCVRIFLCWVFPYVYVYDSDVCFVVWNLYRLVRIRVCTLKLLSRHRNGPFSNGLVLLCVCGQWEPVNAYTVAILCVRVICQYDIHFLILQDIAWNMCVSRPGDSSSFRSTEPWNLPMGIRQCPRGCG